MFSKIPFLVTAVLALGLSACRTTPQELQQTEVPQVDPYLGQTPPGLTALPFDTDGRPQYGWKIGGGFASDSQEYYLINEHSAPYDPSVIVFRKEDRGWKQYDFYTTYSNDGNTLYWRNQYIERTDEGWSKMKSLGPLFEREDWGIMRVTASNKGTYVFDDWKSNDVIRVSRIVEGKREEPQLLGPEINQGKWTAHPMIAPDESYLIFDSERAEGYGDSDLYVTFRMNDGTWGPAQNLGDQVNTPLQENSSWVTPDGKYLFFWRAEEKTHADGSTYWDAQKYWVSMEAVERFRPNT